MSTRLLLVLSLCLGASGCATQGDVSGTMRTASLAGTRAVTAQAVRDNIAPGISTRAAVLAALGQTTSIRFDNGYEVWVYRYTGATPETSNDAKPAAKNSSGGDAELVLLFSAAGVLTKSRIRAAPAVQSPR
jgi:hypothetical protein